MPLDKRIHYSGVVILVAGVIAAVLIYVFSPADPPAGAAAEIASGRSYEFQIERLGGKATVYAVRFNDWLATLWHGERLAWTVGVLSIVIALACFWAAGLVSVPVSDQENDRKKVD